MSERCDSGAMWALYAEQHKGIVFGISAAVERLRGTIGFLERVTYSDERPQCPFPLLDKNALLRAVITKSVDWSYQREWRLVAGIEHTEYLEDGEVTEIVIGYEAEPEIAEMSVKLKTTGTRVFRARPHTQLHSITRDEL